MVSALLIATGLLLLVVIAFQVAQFRRGSDIAKVGVAKADLAKADIDSAAIGHMFSSVEKAHERTERCVREEIGKNRDEAAAGAKAVREEVAAVLGGFGHMINTAMESLGSSQRTNLGRVGDELSKLTESNDRKLEAARTAIDERLKHIQEDSGRKLDQLRLESGASSKQLRDEIGLSLNSFTELLTRQVNTLTDSSEKRMDALRTIVEEKLRALQEDNTKSLEQMRQTVDEKLHGALEQRLGESFKLVSERLEQVYKGLGEMQTLASGVGDLKRVLTNVKSRGTWGEVQLSAMLEQVLSPEQFDTNVAVRDNGERVEFAVKLPHRGEDDSQVLYLPIDSKFPIEDYQRLVEAQDRADTEAAEAAAKQLELRIRQCAKDICTKYINPPRTTDFAVLFLPTEGLFAEVLRRAGLSEMIQRECRVVIAGPTTLWSILNSLQMGFRTLAIQKRSSEVWKVLGAVKSEFTKYGQVLAKVQRKLNEASDTIENDVARRSRAIERRLRGVEDLPPNTADALLLTTNGDLEIFADEEP